MKIRPLIFAAICGISFLSISCSGETSTTAPQARSVSSQSSGSVSNSGGGQTLGQCLENARALTEPNRSSAERLCESGQRQF